MNLNRLNRKTHYWATAFIALPLLVIICSGLLLQMKKHSAWIQPEEQIGTGTVPQIDFEGIIASVRSESSLGARSWDDIDRIDVRPGKGVAKVRLNSGWEIQVDLGSGEVLQTAYRRSDLIESIHDGTLFGGDWVKLGIFLPTGVVLLAMWMSGMWMFWVPFSRRRQKRRRSQTESSRQPSGPRSKPHDRVKLPPAGGSRILP